MRQDCKIIPVVREKKERQLDCLLPKYIYLSCIMIMCPVSKDTEKRIYFRDVTDV